MLFNKIILVALISFYTMQSFAQNESVKSNNYLKGVLLDTETKEPLPYANIVIQRINRGSITNEMGEFTIDTTGLILSDSIRFLYLGYQSISIDVNQLTLNEEVYLTEDIQNLNKVFVYGSPPSAQEIIEKVVENRVRNYTLNTQVKKVFYRTRNDTEVENLDLDYKKSSISVVDENVLKELQNNTPKHSSSYIDFMGNLYYSGKESDTLKYKLIPVKTVELKEKSITELNETDKALANVFSDVEENEYWKLQTGIFGVKMDEAEIDTVQNERNTSSTLSGLKKSLQYSKLTSKHDWGFLYSTNKYNYELAGGTTVNNEDVYVINFTPKEGGVYEGRVYVSVETYALIKADYQYAKDKVGLDIQFLGIGYKEDFFSGSILFERIDSTYQLKYCSKKVGYKSKIDRTISMVKKKERFLFDKKLNQLKFGLFVKSNVDNSFELLVLEQNTIPYTEFLEIKEEETHYIQYVNQFDDALWKGHSIIEPTQKMREYKKQELK